MFAGPSNGAPLPKQAQRLYRSNRCEALRTPIRGLLRLSDGRRTASQKAHSREAPRLLEGLHTHMISHMCTQAHTHPRAFTGNTHTDTQIHTPITRARRHIPRLDGQGGLCTAMPCPKLYTTPPPSPFCTCPDTCTHTHTCTHTSTHTCTHTRVYTHTNTQSTHRHAPRRWAWRPASCWRSGPSRHRPVRAACRAPY